MWTCQLHGNIIMTCTAEWVGCHMAVHVALGGYFCDSPSGSAGIAKIFARVP